jgi:hypothetical protein
MFGKNIFTPLRRAMNTNRLRARLFCQALEVRTTPSTFTVSNLLDSGPGSLRQALSDANGNPGADTITFGNLTGSIPVTSAELSISDAVTINGPGSSLLTVAATGGNRVFDTAGAPSKTAITISGLTITGGKATQGGAIYVSDEALTLTNCVVTGNSATNNGGAVYAYASASSLSFQGCTISNNTAVNAGGGIAEQYTGSVIIQSTTIANNTTTSGGAGGIYMHSGTLLLTNSTVSGNSGAGDGGGMFLPPSYTPTGLTIRNCTIANNKSSGAGGGIMLLGVATLSLQNSDVTGNSAATGAGGIANTYHACTLNAESCVIAGNINGTAPDIGVATVAAKNCAIGSNKGFILTDQGGNLAFGTTLKLGPLANNGGPTLTQLPALDSPLLNAGSNPASVTFDQRGTGFARTANGKTDIGAVEVPIVSVVSNNNDSGPGSLRQAILNSNGLASPLSGIINFDPTFAATNPTITLNSELAITNSVTINGPGSGVLTVNGNGVGRVFDINGGVGSLIVNISGMTITGGNTASPGGGIFDEDEAVTLTDCVITANQSGEAGAGILVQSGAGSLTLQRCVVSNNQVTAGIGQKAGDGGGIDIFGSSTVIIDSTSITGNTAKEHGGGLYFFSGGTLTLTNSTISGNVAKSGSGGAMYFLGTATGLTIRNSTVSGNVASVSGGALYLSSFVGTATIQNSTITNNTATNGVGGGIARVGGTGTIALESTIVSGNVNATAADISSSGTVSAKTSAIGSSAGFTLTSLGGNLPFNTNLKLGPLANNGGLTQTHLPLLSSPLINAGSNPATALTTDQRGLFRTVMGQIDIGAVEVQDLVVTNNKDSGAGSLRQAVLDANSLFVGANTITFDPVFVATPQTITLTTGELAITDTLTIQGPGSAILTVNGNAAGRIFNIDRPGSSGNPMVLSGMTISNGKSAAAGGGIIDVDEALTMTDCIVTGNQSSLTGGGIFVQFSTGSLTLQNCKVTNNSVTAGTGLKAGDGGGINIQGASKVVIDRSTVSGNTANEDGGAVYFYQGGSLILTNSTISGNTAKLLQGGGLFFYGSVSTPGLIMQNATFSGNVAHTTGGGICLVDLAGTCAVQNVTITNNTAQVGYGGGIARTSGPGTITLESSIVSGNTNVNAPDIYGSGNISASFCAIGSSTGLTLSSQNNNLPFGAVLNLGPLANNGGPTLTHALLSGSPCINAGSNPAMLTTDQRGAGFSRAAGGTADIGAFELQAPRVVNVQINDGTAQRSRVTSVQIVFDQVVSLPANPADAFQLKRQSDSMLVGLTAGVANGSSTTVTLTFAGALSESGSLADGRYTLTISAATVSSSSGQLDGNGDGIGGDDYVLVGSPGTAPNLFRLYGDVTGDGTVSADDFVVFRQYFGGYLFAFDFDGDGSVSASDFIQFRLRFGGSI